MYLRMRLLNILSWTYADCSTNTYLKTSSQGDSRKIKAGRCQKQDKWGYETMIQEEKILQKRSSSSRILRGLSSEGRLRRGRLMVLALTPTATADLKVETLCYSQYLTHR
ncbi:uncharacterized protein LOC144283179 isoform X2 [Canis aureus]